MQIPIISGIFSNSESDFRVSYPRNLEPVALENGISSGYLRPADGIVTFGTGPGTDRGGINWNDQCYRVMGSKLVLVASDGTVTTIGDVGSTGPVKFDYSFDYLAVSSAGGLYLYDGAVLTQITDVDLGTVVDFIWIDGYFLATDGEFLIVTELANPFSVNPLKYASSEVDPDPIVGIIKLRNEVHAVNRYTIEIFQNVGGTLFPFQRVSGAQMQRGAVGTRAFTLFMDRIAFVGSGRNETISVWLGANGMTEKVSTREIELILGEYTETELADVIVESRLTRGQHLLYIHLPDQTVVFNWEATQLIGKPVWYTLTSSVVGKSKYRAQNFVRCYDKWLCGDPSSSNHGYLVESVSSHYGEVVGWDFGTIILYNEGRGALIHSLELVALTGRTALGVNPTIWTQYSLDGMAWSQEKPISSGLIGDRTKRLVWFQQGALRNFRIQRFRGTSDSHASFARLEAQLEPLAF